MVTKFLARLLLSLLAVVVSTALIAKRRLPVRDEPDEPDISLVSIFDGTSLRPSGHAFRGGSIYSIFGGTTLDLRRAELDRPGGHLEVTTIYGGTDITVPDSWMVTVTGPTIAAGSEISVTDPDTLAPDAPRFSITARTLFGALSVTARPVLRPAGAPTT
jgi:hypothetical protein